MLFLLFALAASTAHAQDGVDPALAPDGKPIIELVPEPGPSPIPETGELPKFRDWGATLALNVPHPLFIDVEKRYGTLWSAALGAGGLSVKFPGKIALQLGIAAIDIRGRWHPFHGAFFLGAALGYQTMSGSAIDPIAVPGFGTVTTTITAKIQSPYVTPQFGWNFFASGGFTIGVDFGVQIPFAPKTVLTITADRELVNDVLEALQQTPQYQELNDKVADAGNKIGGHVLPFVTLLRLGWMF